MSTIGVGRAFRNQDRLARERRERQEQTVDGQRGRRGTPRGLAPISEEAVLQEAEASFHGAIRASRRFSVFAVLCTAVPVGAAIMALSVNPMMLGPKSLGGLIMTVVFGLLGALLTLILAAQGARELAGLARWSDRSVPVVEVWRARLTLALVVAVSGLSSLVAIGWVMLGPLFP